MAGIKPRRLDRHVNLDVSTAVTAVGVYLRLLSMVPVLLLGDFSTRSDVALSRLVGDMSQSSAKTLSFDTKTINEFRELICGPVIQTDAPSLLLVRSEAA